MAPAGAARGTAAPRGRWPGLPRLADVVVLLGDQEARLVAKAGLLATRFGDVGQQASREGAEGRLAAAPGDQLRQVVRIHRRVRRRRALDEAEARAKLEPGYPVAAHLAGLHVPGPRVEDVVPVLRPGGQLPVRPGVAERHGERRDGVVGAVVLELRRHHAAEIATPPVAAIARQVAELVSDVLARTGGRLMVGEVRHYVGCSRINELAVSRSRSSILILTKTATLPGSSQAASATR